MARAIGPHAVVLSTSVLLAALSPLVRDRPRDDFPLSHYPMFAERRDDMHARIRHVIGRSRDGRDRPVPPDLVGTEEVMQAHQTIAVAVQRGSHTAAELCQTVAARVATAPDLADIDALEVRTDVYDVIEYFAGDRRPQKVRVHARCEVARTEQR
jgi:hypothetical protein